MDGEIAARYLRNIVLGSFVILILLPFVYVVVAAFFSPDTAQNFSQLDERTISLLFKSVLLAAVVAFFATLIGGALAFFLYKTEMKFAATLKILVLIPLFVSPYVFATAWRDFFFSFFSRTDIFAPLLGTAWVLILVYAPLAMIVIGNAFANVDATFEEQGLTVTAPRNVIIKIVFPLVKKAFLTAFVLVFIFALSNFSVPELLGANVFAVEIFTEFSAFYNHSLAIIQALLLALVCLSLLTFEKKQISEARFFSVGLKGKKTFRYNIKNPLPFLFVLFWIFLTSFFPLAVLISKIPDFKTLANAFALLRDAILNSLGLSFVSAIFIVLIGLAATLGSDKNKPTAFFNGSALFTFALPSIALGIALIKFYNTSALEFIYATAAIIVLAHVGKFSFVSAKIIGNALSQIPASFEEAAKLAGAKYFTRMFKIILPQIAPALFATFAISFVFSFGEVAATIMVYPPGTELLSVKVFTISSNAPQALVSAMTFLLFASTLSVFVLFYLISKPFMKKFNFANA